MNKKTICFLLCGILSLVFCSCKSAAFGKSNNSESLESTNSNHTSIDFDGNNASEGCMLPSLKNVYALSETSSMVLAELQGIEGVLSNDPSVSAIYSDYLMTKFRIIEDYYQKLSKNTIITIPVKLNMLNENVKAMNLSDGDEENVAIAHSMNNVEDDTESTTDMDSIGDIDNERGTLNAEIVSNFLNENKQAILYFRFVYESQKWYKNRDWKDSVTLNCISCGIRLPENYIPVNNGIVECNIVLNFLDENNCSYNSLNDIYNFSSFICNGMSLFTAKENICKLYQTQLDKSVK